MRNSTVFYRGASQQAVLLKAVEDHFDVIRRPSSRTLASKELTLFVVRLLPDHPRDFTEQDFASFGKLTPGNYPETDFGLVGRVLFLLLSDM